MSLANKIGIVGSCVTRDAFEHTKDLQVDFYLARSSLASIYAKPWPSGIDDDEIRVEGKGAWENRMLRHDLFKDARDIIRDSKCSPIFMDLIDERFDLFASDVQL